MNRRAVLWAGLAGVLAGGAGLALWRTASPKAMEAAAFNALYTTPLTPPDAALSVYHLGHSLVGRDMPVMLNQLAAAAGFTAHSHASQLGWGASLDQHRKGDVPGMEQENAHPNHRPADTALASGAYDAVVLTEMVEIRDAIRYHDSANALAHWARTARAGNPTRVCTSTKHGTVWTMPKAG